MARILTGIQSSGKPHLGNILGAILPAIQLSEQAGNDSFLFIADLHSFTTIKNPVELKENTRAIAAAWLACGLDTERVTFYRQSQVAAYHTELMWYLSCVTPYPMLANAHSFKDKSDRLADVNAGLFVYQLLSEQKVLVVAGTGFNYITPDHFRIVCLPQLDELTLALDRMEFFLDSKRAYSTKTVEEFLV